MLVCEPCSKRCVALPEFGIERERRVCDSCFFDLGFREGGGDVSMARSFVDSDGEDDHEDDDEDEIVEGGGKMEEEIAPMRAASRSRTDSGRRR